MRLRGRGVGAGAVLAGAVVVRVNHGVPVMPEPPERIALQLAAGRTPEKLDVVLVADDYSVARALGGLIEWAAIVGVVASRAADISVTPPFPVVLGVPDVAAAVQTGMLVMVDAARGLVIVQPSLEDIAAFQAQTQNLAPRRRLYLDDAHLPAETLDGVNLRVAAVVRTAADIQEAMDQGADALYLPGETSLLTFSTDANEQVRAFREIVQLAPGKLLLVADAYALDATAAVGIEVMADLILCAPPRADLLGLGLAELAAELAAAVDACSDNELPAAMPRVALEVDLDSLDSADDLIATTSASGATHVVMRPTYDLGSPMMRAHAVECAAAAASHLVWPWIVLDPVRFDGAPVEPELLDGDIAIAAGAGITGLIVPAHTVAHVKDAVRALSASAARELLLAVTPGQSDTT